MALGLVPNPRGKKGCGEGGRCEAWGFHSLSNLQFTKDDTCGSYVTRVYQIWAAIEPTKKVHEHYVLYAALQNLLPVYQTLRQQIRNDPIKNTDIHEALSYLRRETLTEAKPQQGGNSSGTALQGQSSNRPRNGRNQNQQRRNNQQRINKPSNKSNTLN